MRAARPCLLALVIGSALLAAGAAAAQAPNREPQPPSPGPAKPYKPVPITMPAPVSDPSFEAFRKQLGDAAAKKDRSALARMVAAKDFFWLTEDGDKAAKNKSGIDNLTTALKLGSRDGGGWEMLSGYALDPTAAPSPDRKGVICAPADPSFDERQLEDLAKSTQTDPGEWGYPLRDGLEVRSGPQANAPVIENLGLHLVRVLPEDGPATPSKGAPPPLRVVTPSGKTGYVPIEEISPIGTDQLCYIKDAGGWKITGYVGGEP